MVVFLDLGKNHLWRYDSAPGIVDIVVVAFLVAKFDPGHISAGGIEPFLVSGDLGDCQMSFVEPSVGRVHKNA
jgi:hypothetical protein